MQRIYKFAVVVAWLMLGTLASPSSISPVGSEVEGMSEVS